MVRKYSTKFFCASKLFRARTHSGITTTMLYTLVPKLISSVLSIMQSTGLRNRVYAMEDRLDILETAIEDIERINANASNPNQLITSICTNVRKHQATISEYYENH